MDLRMKIIVETHFQLYKTSHKNPAISVSRFLMT